MILIKAEAGRLCNTSGMRPHLLSTLTAIVLAAIVALTGVTAAMARGYERGFVSIVICGAGGAQSIVVDSEGKPARTRHVCPDCVAAFGPALLSGLAVAGVSGFHPEPEVIPKAAVVFVARSWRIDARGPPVGQENPRARGLVPVRAGLSVRSAFVTSSNRHAVEASGAPKREPS